MLRFANSADAASPPEPRTPSSPPLDTGGDVSFDRSGRKPVAGNYDYLTIVHEIGHTLGLKHGTRTLGALPRPRQARVHGDDLPQLRRRGRPLATARSAIPQTFMMLDIAALQHLYGADFTTHADNTTYSWNPATGATSSTAPSPSRPPATASSSRSGTAAATTPTTSPRYADRPRHRPPPRRSLDLRAAQLADLGGGPNGGHARGNIFNALLYHDDTALADRERHRRQRRRPDPRQRREQPARRQRRRRRARRPAGADTLLGGAATTSCAAAPAPTR